MKQVIREANGTAASWRMRRIGITYAVISLFVGFTVGLFRLFKDNGTFYLQTMTPLYHLHSIFLIFGFLGGLLMTERLAGSAGVTGRNSVKFSAAMVLLFLAGELALPTGWVYQYAWLRILGGILLMAGALMFTLLLIRLGRMASDYSSFGIMASGTVSLALAALLTGFELPNDNLPLIMQMLLFPVLFIIGERVELTRFTYFPHKKTLVASVFALSWIAVGTTCISSLMYKTGVAAYALMLTIAALVVLLIAAITLAMEQKRSMPGAVTRLQIYLKRGINIAYLWLLAGVMLFILRINGVTGLYDASIHAIALGFIATFIVAHGPVIFPVVLGRKADISKLTFMSLYLLTLANVLRVFGDIAKIFAGNMTAVLAVSEDVVSMSAVVLVLSVIAFAVMIRRMISTADR